MRTAEIKDGLMVAKSSQVIELVDDAVISYTLDSSNPMELQDSSNFTLVNRDDLRITEGYTPAWLDAVLGSFSDSVSSSSATLAADINYSVRQLDEGITQSIVQIRNENESRDIRVEGQLTLFGSSLAGVIGTVDTKVTAEQASAAALELVNASFNGSNGLAESWVLSKTQTISDNISVMSEDIIQLGSQFSLLSGSKAEASIVNDFFTEAGIDPDGHLNSRAGYIQAALVSVGDLEVSLDGTGSVLAGQPPAWDGISPTTLGMLNAAGTQQWFPGLGWVDYSVTALGSISSSLQSVSASADRVAVIRFGTTDPYLDINVPAAINRDVWISDSEFYPEYVKDASGNDTAVLLTPQPYNYPKVRVMTDGSWVPLATVGDVQKLNIQWAGGASKLLKGPDGSITGWSFGNGNGIESSFKINADKFILSDSTGSHQPLTIDATGGPGGTPISKFNGVVSFTNSDMSGYENSNLAADLADPWGTTVIDGGKISTGIIKQNGYNSLDNTKNSKWNLITGEFVTHNNTTVEADKFILDSTVVGSYTTPNIQGGYIKGGTVIADIAQSSTFYPGSSGWRLLADGSAEFNNIVVSRDFVVVSGTTGSYRLNTTSDHNYRECVSEDSYGGCDRYGALTEFVREYPTGITGRGASNTDNSYTASASIYATLIRYNGTQTPVGSSWITSNVNAKVIRRNRMVSAGTNSFNNTYELVVVVTYTLDVVHTLIQYIDHYLEWDLKRIT